MPDKCILDPERDCLGLIKAKEVEGDLAELRRQNSASHERIFDRLSELEKEEAVQAERFRNISDTLDGMRDTLGDLKKDSRELTRTLPELVLRVKALEKDGDATEQEVDKLRGKPGETWEHLKKQGLGWILALLLAIVAVAMGLGKYL